MATFELVHGGGLGAWSWEFIIPRLEAAGHTVVAPELPLDAQGLDECTQIGADALAGADGPIVVVGHALGCTVLPLIASRVDASLMIWICGMIPISGISATDQINRDPSMVPMYADRDPVTKQLPQNAFVDSLVHDCKPDVQKWAADRLSVATHKDGSVTVVNEPFPEGGIPSVPSVYILTEDDRALAAPQARAAAKELLGVKAIELPGGHCPIFSRPDEVSDILLRSAGDLALRRR